MPLNASKTGILVFFLLLSFPKKCDKILFAVKIQGMRKEFFMSRRGENIFKRKDGRWEARYIHHYENGVAKYRYLYADSYAEVKQKRLDELAMPHNCISVQAKSLATVEQLAADWLIDTKTTVKESTYTRYCMTVEKHILPALGKYALKRVDFHTVNRFSAELMASGGANRRPLSPKSVADILCVLKSIFKFGRLNGYPCAALDSIRYPQKAAKPIHILSPSHTREMERILLDSEDSTSLGILFTLFTGVRIGELCGLRWGDIDLKRATVTIKRTVERINDLDPSTDTKTKLIVSEPKTATSNRMIPLPSFLLNRLEKLRKSDADYLVTGTTDFIEPHCFYLRYRRFMRSNHMDEYTFHALRHTFATRCVESGFDTKSLSEILGHANVGTTLNFYVHPTLEQKRAQMERLTPACLS